MLGLSIKKQSRRTGAKPEERCFTNASGAAEQNVQDLCRAFSLKECSTNLMDDLSGKFLLEKIHRRSDLEEDGEMNPIFPRTSEVTKM